jgi:cytochrome c-type biogenesis protein CcmH
VTLSAGLQARAAGAKALYVIARKAGTRDIVAVKRVDAPSFPAAFELSAGDAMVPGSAFTGPFDLTARLSKSGDAIPAPGDLEGSVAGVAAGAKGVGLTLDTVRQ